MHARARFRAIGESDIDMVRRRRAFRSRESIREIRTTCGRFFESFGILGVSESGQVLSLAAFCPRCSKISARFENASALRKSGHGKFFVGGYLFLRAMPSWRCKGQPVLELRVTRVSMEQHEKTERKKEREIYISVCVRACEAIERVNAGRAVVSRARLQARRRWSRSWASGIVAA